MTQAAVTNRDRVALAERLRARRPEIEEAILSRVFAIPTPNSRADPGYVDGLRGAVAAAIDYGLIRVGCRSMPDPVPTALLSQAREAARHGVGLESVLRRYLAGHTVMADFLIHEAEHQGLHGNAVAAVQRDQAVLFDRVVMAVSEEYSREADARPSNPKRRRTRLVRSLLSGDLFDPSDLAYELDMWHLGLVATGPGAPGAIRQLAVRLDRSLLLVYPGDEIVWAWLGGRREFAALDVADLSSALPTGTNLAVGEPARDIGGWRLTHRQATAALPIARRTLRRVVRYRDVALVSAVARDDLVANFLHERFLHRLEVGADDGKALLDTLRAYFAADRQVVATAFRLGKSRQTVSARLRRAEEQLGTPISRCAFELQAALQLDALERHAGQMPLATCVPESR